MNIVQAAQFQSALRSVSLAGFLVTATLIIGLNFKIFTNIFKDRASRYWWLFLGISIVPILVAIYLYTFFFGSKA